MEDWKPTSRNGSRQYDEYNSLSSWFGYNRAVTVNKPVCDQVVSLALLRGHDRAPRRVPAKYDAIVEGWNVEHSDFSDEVRLILKSMVATLPRNGTNSASDIHWRLHVGSVSDAANLIGNRKGPAGRGPEKRLAGRNLTVSCSTAICHFLMRSK